MCQDALLSILTKLKKPAVLPSLPYSGRFSLLGPGVEARHPLLPLHPPPDHIPHKKVFAEDLFADDDQWQQFQVEEAVPGKQYLDQRKMWLMANSLSTVSKSSGVGWIAVKFKDKAKEVVETKAA